MFVKWAVNKIKAEVQMIDGKIKILPNGWKGLTAKEVEHDDIIYAIRKEWIELKKTEPTTPENPPKPKVTFVNEDQRTKEPTVTVTELGTKKE